MPTCPAFRTKWAVYVVHSLECGGSLQRLCDFGSQGALFVNEPNHLGPAVREAPQVFQALPNGAQDLFIEPSGLFFAVASQEWNGVSLIQ